MRLGLLKVTLDLKQSFMVGRNQSCTTLFSYKDENKASYSTLYSGLSIKNIEHMHLVISWLKSPFSATALEMVVDTCSYQLNSVKILS